MLPLEWPHWRGDAPGLVPQALSLHVRGRKWCDPVGLSYLFHSQHINDLVKQGCSQQVSVDQQSLQSVTGSWIFTFRVSD